MAKIAVRQLPEIPAEPAVVLSDERPSRGVLTRRAFSDSAPIQLRMHLMPGDAMIRWENSARGHLAYIWSGSVQAGARKLGAGSVLLIEHRASAEIKAEKEGAEIIVFNVNPDSEPMPERAGGHVHILGAGQEPRVERMRGNESVGAALFADSRCPTCELWLHENSIHAPGYPVHPHYHSENEVILVTAGEIVLGHRRYGRGTAIAVEREAVYSFQAGQNGLRFINFRAGRPSYARAGDEHPVDELAFYTELARPDYQDV
jgi:hypothetical protein